MVQSRTRIPKIPAQPKSIMRRLHYPTFPILRSPSGLLPGSLVHFPLGANYGINAVPYTRRLALPRALCLDVNCRSDEQIALTLLIHEVALRMPAGVFD